MADVSEDANDIEKLYEYGERLNEAKNKSENVEDYRGIIKAKDGSLKARQLAAQLIPRFFKFFPSLSTEAVNAHFDLCEADELGVRVQAIRGLPLLCKDTPENVSKIVDVLGQMLTAEENVERDAVHKAVMSLLRQDVKASLSALFKHIDGNNPGAEETIRENVLNFIKNKVFPLKAELLKPQEQMERHITDLVKKSLTDVTGAEFEMFMSFLKSLKIFGEGAPRERVQELVEIIEGQADLYAPFSATDGDHIDRLISCLSMALPFFMRGASNSKFVNYLNKFIVPVFDQLPDEKRKLDLLKNLAEGSPYTSPQDSRQFLPSVVQLLKNVSSEEFAVCICNIQALVKERLEQTNLKKFIPKKKTEEWNFTYVECLLYTFHQLSHKTPNATNSLCGYKIVTGQPSDRLGEDFSEQYKDFTERLSSLEDYARASLKKITQGMDKDNKALAAAKTEDERTSIKLEKQKATTELRALNNITLMIKPLRVKAPSFIGIGDKNLHLSWKEVKASKPSAATGAGVKRPATAANGSGATTNKKGRGDGGARNLVGRAFEELSHGGRSGVRGRSWGGRGRGRGYR